MKNTTPINLRPTLIIGLGGSGSRIAVQLKARLEDELGSDSNYHRAIKILCLDTANEKFTALQPNHPDREPVRLAPDREYVRISDVPLYDLMRSKETNEAIASIFPEVLHSTQIDQGAQQVRRLGRIALFYHYGRIKEKISQAIRALRQMDVMDRLGPIDDEKELYVADRQRLRVFVLSSLCGGTGAGIFIDIAYLARHLALDAGVPSTRAVDVIGMLLLPEAFPEISTTGGARIRANAYASLLDLEYYNQATEADEKLYRVDLPGERIEVTGSPFSLCYLINSSGPPGTMRGVADLAPMLADSLMLMITSRMGEQLDATLDNVRASLTVYHGGYRAFYSALGMAQIVYPFVWLKQQFGQRLKREIIERFILPQNISLRDTRDAAQKWFNEQQNWMRAELDTDLLSLKEDVVNRLKNFAEETHLYPNPTAQLQTEYRTCVRQFEQTIITQVHDNAVDVERRLRTQLNHAVDDFIDKGLTAEPPCGLSWTLTWLDDLAAIIYNELENPSYLDHNAPLSEHLQKIYAVNAMPLLGEWWGRKRSIPRAAYDLSDYLENRADRIVIENEMRNIFLSSIRWIEQHRDQVNAAIQFWDRERRRSQEQEKPQYTLVTQTVIDEHELNQHLAAKLREILPAEDDQTGHASHLDLRKQVENAFKDATNGQSGLSRSLDLSTREEIQRALTHLCMSYYDAITDRGDVIEHLNELSPIRREDMIRSLGDMAQPLLSYSKGLLQAIPPRIIQVLGAKTQSAAEDHIRPLIGDQMDLSTVATHNQATTALLITHHGIPISALAKLETYRGHYEQLQDEPNAIFHLDTERENAPYDPGSFYFVNLADFHTYFARTLAYNWLVRTQYQLRRSDNRVDLQDTFAFDSAFFSYFSIAINRQITIINNEIEALENRMVDRFTLDDFTVGKTQRRLKQLHTMNNELQQYLATCIPARNLEDGVLVLNRNEHDYADFHVIMRPPEGREHPTIPAQTLIQTRDAIFRGQSRLVPQFFIEAVNNYYATQLQTDRITLENLIKTFLSERRYRDYAHDDSRRQQDFTMRLSQPGQPSYELEQRLCAILSVYLRTLKQKERGLRTNGYWTPSEELL